MGLAMDVQVGTATNPGGNVTDVTPASGDSFTIRNASGTSATYLEQIARLGAAAGVVEVKSSLMHDDVHGIRLRSVASQPTGLLSAEVPQLVRPQDTLVVGVTGGAAEVDGAALFFYYMDLPGAAARLHSLGDVQGLIKNLVGVEVAVTTAGTAGNWSSAAVNATFDQLHANTDYAVLGYEVDTQVLAVAVSGPDTGNLRCGGPGTTDPIKSRGHFVEQTLKTGRPHIPVFNASNKSSTMVSVSGIVTATAVNVNLILAELDRPIG